MSNIASEELTTFAAQWHAATAELTRRAADVDDSGEWEGVGFRSCAHWLSVSAGLDTWSAGELLRVGHALRRLPRIAEAFSQGRLSYDKVRLLTLVALAVDEDLWLDIGLQASGSQCGRIVRAFRRSLNVDDSGREFTQRYSRRLRSWWRDDGMLDIVVTLAPEDGRLVMAAIEAAMQQLPAAANAEAHPADAPWLARRADALVDVCRQWLGAAASAGDRESAPREVVVHVDAGVLTTKEVEGRCHIEDGPAISAAAARRIGCDADVVAVIERGGVPVHVGRSRRLVTGRMRRALQLRDHTCRYPGCSVVARDTEAHHIEHWADGGRTELRNLVCLCRFHHHRYHDGAFTIHAVNGGVEFKTRAGERIAPGSIPPVTEPRAVVRQLSAISGMAMVRARREGPSP